MGGRGAKQATLRRTSVVVSTCLVAVLAAAQPALAQFETPDEPLPVPCENPSTPGHTGNDPDCDPGYSDSFLGEFTASQYVAAEGDEVTFTWTPFFGARTPGDPSAPPQASYAAWNSFANSRAYDWNPVVCTDGDGDCVLQVVKGNFAPRPDDTGTTGPVNWNNYSVNIANGIGPANEQIPFYIQPSYYWAQFQILDENGADVTPSTDVTATLIRRPSAGVVYPGETLGEVLLRYRLYRLTPANAVLAFGAANPDYVGYGVSDLIPPGPVQIPAAESVFEKGTGTGNVITTSVRRDSTYDVRITDPDGNFYPPFELVVGNANIVEPVQAIPDPLEVVDVRSAGSIDPIEPFDVEIDVRNVSTESVTDVRAALGLDIVPQVAEGGASVTSTSPSVVPTLGPGATTTFTLEVSPLQPGELTMRVGANGRYQGVSVKADPVSRSVDIGGSDLVAFWELEANSDAGDVMVIPGPDGPTPTITVLPDDEITATLVVRNIGDEALTDVRPGGLRGAEDLLVPAGPAPTSAVLAPGSEQRFSYDMVSEGGDHQLSVEVTAKNPSGTTVSDTASAGIDTFGLTLEILDAPDDIDLFATGEVHLRVTADDARLLDVTVSGPTQTGGDGLFQLLGTNSNVIPVLEPFQHVDLTYTALRTAEGSIDWEATAIADVDEEFIDSEDYEGLYYISGSLTDTVRGDFAGERITVRLDVPEGAADETFTFTAGPDLPGFQINAPVESEATMTVDPGTYAVTMAVPEGWELLEVSCADPDDGSSGDPESATASIDVDDGEHVVCAFSAQPTATIKVLLQVPAGSPPEDFDFDAGPDLPGFRITAPSESEATIEAGAGTYPITELVPDGWELTDLACTDPDGGTTTDTAAGTATVDLDEAETVECTFTNEPSAIVRVFVEVPDGAPGTFLFDGGPDLPGFSIATPGESMAEIAAPVGTHPLTQTLPDGWELSDIDCVDPDNGSVIDFASGSVAIDVDEDETIECTFANQPTSKIRVFLETPGGVAGSAAFTYAVSGDLPGFTISHPDQSQAEIFAAAGTFTITQQTPDGWELTDLSCVDPDGGTSVDLAAGTANVDVDADETVDCTFTNEPAAVIVIMVDTGDVEATDVFPFVATGGLGNFAVDTESQSMASIAAAPGSYVVTETVPAAWRLTAISCDDPDDETTSSDTAATVDLDDGEIVTCTFTNEPAAQIQVIVDSPPGGGDQAFEFTATELAGFTITRPGQSQATVAAEPGLYAVTETVPDGWDLLSISCVDPTGGTTTSVLTATATIDLSEGDAVVCTFANEPTAAIELVVDAPENSGAAAFVFEAGGGLPSTTINHPGQSQASIPAATGTYPITQLLPDGWKLSGLTCSDPDGGTTADITSASVEVDLDDDEVVTCTFTVEPEASIVVRVIVPADAGAATFGFSGGPLGDFAIDSPAESQSSVAAGPGSYPISQTLPEGWRLTAIDCVDDDGGTTTDVANKTVVVDLDADETVECTFTNEPLAWIIVNVETLGEPLAQTFTFDAGNGLPGFDIATPDQSQAEIAADPGTYPITQRVPDGWSLVSIDCDDPDGGTVVDLISGRATIDLDDAETVECTFTNTVVVATPIRFEFDGRIGGEQGTYQVLYEPDSDSGNIFVTLQATPLDIGLLCPEPVDTGCILTAPTEVNDGSTGVGGTYRDLADQILAFDPNGVDSAVAAALRAAVVPRLDELAGSFDAMSASMTGLLQGGEVTPEPPGPDGTAVARVTGADGRALQRDARDVLTGVAAVQRYIDASYRLEDQLGRLFTELPAPPSTSDLVKIVLPLSGGTFFVDAAGGQPIVMEGSFPSEACGSSICELDDVGPTIDSVFGDLGRSTAGQNSLAREALANPIRTLQRDHSQLFRQLERLADRDRDGDGTVTVSAGAEARLVQKRASMFKVLGEVINLYDATARLIVEASGR